MTLKALIMFSLWYEKWESGKTVSNKEMIGDSTLVQQQLAKEEWMPSNVSIRFAERFLFVIERKMGVIPSVEPAKMKNHEEIFIRFFA